MKEKCVRMEALVRVGATDPAQLPQEQPASVQQQELEAYRRAEAAERTAAARAEELERAADAEAPVPPACDLDEGVAAGETYIMGRVAVLPAMRRRGLASAIVEASDTCARDAGAKLIKLHAQEYVLPLYEKAGYTQIAPVDYEDEGQPHAWMAKRVDGR